MKIKRIMARQPVTCTAESTVSNAAKVMKNENVGALPVINKKKEVIGIVTDRDICLSVANHRRKKDVLKVGDIMTHDVVTATPEDELADALYRMRASNISRMPVVNLQGKLTGIVSLHHMVANTTRRGAALSVFSRDGREVLNTMGSISAQYDKKGRGRKKGTQKNNNPNTGSIENISDWDDYI